MLTLNLQMGPNPLAAHNPNALLTHPDTPRLFSLGEQGDLVGWQDGRPLFQLCPSLTCENDRLLASTIAWLREPDQVRPSLRVATLHSDSRLRIWAVEDGVCLQVSAAGLFAQLPVALLAAQGESRFLFAVAPQTVFVFDCWFMRVVSRMAPKKESFVRFRGGAVTGSTLELWDSGNRAYRIDVSALLSQQLLDFGSIVTDQAKAEAALARIGESLSSPTPVTAYRRPEAVESPSLKFAEVGVRQAREESVLQAVCSMEMRQVYPQLESVLGEERPTTGSLNFVGGSTLFMMVGTASGSLVILPASVRSGEPLVVIKDCRHAESPVEFIRVVGNLLVASWQSGWLGIYSLQNLLSHLETVRINRTLQSGGSAATAVFTADLSRLAATEQRLSSSVRAMVPAYHSQQGPIRSSLFLRLERNQLVRFDELGSQLSYLRGISEQETVLCVCLIEEYAAVCTARAVELYTVLGYERSLSYEHWKWEDYAFFQTPPSPSPPTSTLIEATSRWAWDQLDYASGGEELLAEALGEGVGVGAEGWAEFYFGERAAVQAGVHSKSADCSAAVLRCKLDKLRRDSWSNCTYFLHGNLNQQLEAFQAQRSPPRDILAKMYDFYMLLPCRDLPVPFLSHELQQSGRRSCLRSRAVVQGAGRSFTVMFQAGNRIRLSERLLCHQAVACVSLLQVWVVKDPTATDHMVEAVQYFARLAACLCPEDGEMALAKLAVSPSQNVSKASINVTISRAMTSAGSLHPIMAYFLLGQREKRGLQYCEAVWLCYLGLGCLFGGLKPQKEQLRQLVGRLVAVMTDCSNYLVRMHLLLAVMRVFNEGVARWRPLLEPDASRLLVDLLRVFFWFDGLATVGPDDKKFNFCFAGCDQASRRAAKQAIVKTVMYVGKEFGQQLLGVLREQSGNQKVHAAYPASVVEVLRQFIKSQRPQSHLVFYVQLLLQCLSPMNPQLRKHVQRNALSTLQLLCTYPNVSFNQPSQKLTLKTHNHLYIYCLRTSTKWRTINLKDEPHHFHTTSIVEMSPKGTYIALLSDKLRVWRLSSGFWSGMLAPFSQDRVFEATGKALKWDENEDSITVIHEDATRNQVFRI